MAGASKTKSLFSTKKKWEPKKPKENNGRSKPITGPKAKGVDKQLTEIKALRKVATTSGPNKPAKFGTTKPSPEPETKANKFCRNKSNHFNILVYFGCGLFL